MGQATLLDSRTWQALQQCSGAGTSGVLARMVRAPEPLVQTPTASPAARQWALMKGAACSSTYTRRCSVPLAHDLMTNSKLRPCASVAVSE